MRVITRKRLVEYGKEHPNIKKQLDRWFALADAAAWKNPADLKATFPAVDPVIVASGNTVYVFNVGAHRLIAAIHFDYPKIFVMRLMDHSEYDQDQWKGEL